MGEGNRRQGKKHAVPSLVRPTKQAKRNAWLAGWFFFRQFFFLYGVYLPDANAKNKPPSSLEAQGAAWSRMSSETSKKKCTLCSNIKRLFG